MQKYLLIALMNCLLINTAVSATRDTTKFYFKNAVVGQNAVKKGDDYDYVRVFLPPDSTEDLINVREFYKTGALKFAAKMMIVFINKNNIGTTDTAGTYEGPAVSYFPSGKKQRIFNYLHGIKKGMEYTYFPDGKPYTVFDNSPTKYNTGWLITCYNKEGEMTCRDGKGEWIIYNDDFTGIRKKGSEKYGRKNGVWQGNALLFSDTIHYTLKYNNDWLESGVGYDKKGNVFPFHREDIGPCDGRLPSNIINRLCDNLEIPNGPDGKTMNIDTVRVSFMIEKDGSITNLATLGKPNPVLTDAVLLAMAKCPPWSSRKFYGMPLRSRITLSIKRVEYPNPKFTFIEDILKE